MFKFQIIVFDTQWTTHSYFVGGLDGVIITQVYLICPGEQPARGTNAQARFVSFLIVS